MKNFIGTTCLTCEDACEALLHFGCFCNIGEIHYHKENKKNGGKQIEFSAESNQFEKKIKSGNK